jgi:hypothetical protein
MKIQYIFDTLYWKNLLWNFRQNLWVIYVIRTEIQFALALKLSFIITELMWLKIWIVQQALAKVCGDELKKNPIFWKLVREV